MITRGILIALFGAIGVALMFSISALLGVFNYNTLSNSFIDLGIACLPIVLIGAGTFLTGMLIKLIIGILAGNAL